tara:strand:- start:315 stop:542 length:228 start_codon:yes stop_codon:yes gene_type:complete
MFIKVGKWIGSKSILSLIFKKENLSHSISINREVQLHIKITVGNAVKMKKYRGKYSRVLVANLDAREQFFHIRLR